MKYQKWGLHRNAQLTVVFQCHLRSHRALGGQRVEDFSRLTLCVTKNDVVCVNKYVLYRSYVHFNCCVDESFGYITDQLSILDCDLFLLTETWLRPATPNRLLVIPGFKINRIDRPDGSGYGGVAIITKTDITSSTLKPTSSQSPSSLLETHWALLKLEQNRQLIVCSLYRPPRHSDASLRADFNDLESVVYMYYRIC